MLLCKPQNSRQVGSAMKNCHLLIEQLNKDAHPDDIIHEESIPWWRVILSAGKISPRENANSEFKQAKLLKQEGVTVLDAHFVDLNQYGWFPDDVDF